MLEPDQAEQSSEGIPLPLPPLFWAGYSAVLSSRGWLDDAHRHVRERDLIGGPADEQARKHFVWRYSVSVARAAYCVADPLQKLEQTSVELTTLLADGEITMLELPAGAGGASVGILCQLHHMRKHRLLPRLPILVRIVGIDLSALSLQLFEEMVEAIQPELLTQGIQVTIETHQKDLTNPYTIPEIWQSLPASHETLVLFANMSGEWGKRERFNKISRCLDHAIERVHDRMTTILWVEPARGNNQATWLLQQIAEKAAYYLNYFSNWLRGGTKVPEYEANFDFQHILLNQSLFGGVRVVKLEGTLGIEN